MGQFCVEISRVGHFRRHALKPRLLELAVCGSCRLIDSESAAIVVHRQVGSNQRLRLVRSTVQATLGSGSTYGILIGQRLGYRAFLIRHFP